MTEETSIGDDFVDIGGGDVIDVKLTPMMSDSITTSLEFTADGLSAGAVEQDPNGSPDNT
jgi:hypothetical protein